VITLPVSDNAAICSLVKGTVNGNSHNKNAFKTVFFHFSGTYCIVLVKVIMIGFEGSGPSCSK
jgi:hypothetical protein